MKKEIFNNTLHQVIKDIKIYNINDHYIEFPDEEGYVVDGGIELHFEKGIVTFGWNFKKEMFELHTKKFSEFSEENSKYLAIDLNIFHKLKKYKNKKVTNLKLFSNDFFTVVDYTLKTKKTFFYTGLLIGFDDNNQLKISSSSYKIDEKTKLPTQINPSVSDDLIIDFGHTFKYENE